MPLTQFVDDLDGLLEKFHNDDCVDANTFLNVRLAVTRMNEIRQQLSIAQEKLGSVLSLAEAQLVSNMNRDDAQSRLPAEGAAVAVDDRFEIHDHCYAGIDDIDDDHYTMIRLANDLHRLACDANAPIEAIDNSLRELIAVTAAHFEKEEQLMTRLCYTKADQHKAVHQRMKAYMAELQSRSVDTPLLIPIRLEKLFGSWFVWHMQLDDGDFAKFLLNKSRQKQ